MYHPEFGTANRNKTVKIKINKKNEAEHKCISS